MIALYSPAPAMLLHSFMGLETLLFSTIVLAGALALFCYREADKGSVTWEIGYALLLLPAGLLLILSNPRESWAGVRDRSRSEKVELVAKLRSHHELGAAS